MHPLPRDSRPEANELDTDLNELDNLAIFRQAQNGVLVRMALFALTLGVEDQLTHYEKSTMRSIVEQVSNSSYCLGGLECQV